MSLKRSNTIAIVLLVIAAILFGLGFQILIQATAPANTIAVNETYWTIPATFMPNTEPTLESSIVPETTYSVASEPQAMPSDSRSGKALGMIFCFFAVACSVAAVFLFRQQKPFLGPDGICLVFAAASALYRYFPPSDNLFAQSVIYLTLLSFALLLCLREIYGWLRAKCTVSWCITYRSAVSQKRHQTVLITFGAWTVLLALIVVLLITAGFVFPVLINSCMLAFFLAFLCLWKYGVDSEHFRQQLNHFRDGRPIQVKPGAFSEVESLLFDLQAQHEKAVRTAVTSERFKVELISNVSHDLRTPLTSILGYSELLQKETLSSDGQTQLQRLQQKAGYMSDLVESLFELTKVSSGVIESKKEEIDLIRLLEQTIGLFDDQLAHASLLVRRNYASDSVLVVTDGTRMHQVFANLLGNAIKYAMAGTRIYLDVKETEDSFLVRMMNTASYEMDFKPEEILQRFARGDKARSTKGSGLGLAIAQTYTESVGGSFQVGVDGDQFSAIVTLPKIERNL